jgi:hypothetical protein
MRKMMTVVLGLAVLMWTAGAARAQTGFGGLGDAVKKDVGDAAKKEVDNTLGVPAADKAANPNAAAKEGADAAKGDVKARAAGAVDVAPGAAGQDTGAAKKAEAPDDDGDEPANDEQ